MRTMARSVAAGRRTRKTYDLCSWTFSSPTNTRSSHSVTRLSDIDSRLPYLLAPNIPAPAHLPLTPLTLTSRMSWSLRSRCCMYLSLNHAYA